MTLARLRKTTATSSAPQISLYRFCVAGAFEEEGQLWGGANNVGTSDKPVHVTVIVPSQIGT